MDKAAKSSRKNNRRKKEGRNIYFFSWKTQDYVDIYFKGESEASPLSSCTNKKKGFEKCCRKREPEGIPEQTQTLPQYI